MKKPRIRGFFGKCYRGGGTDGSDMGGVSDSSGLMTRRPHILGAAGFSGSAAVSSAGSLFLNMPAAAFSISSGLTGSKSLDTASINVSSHSLIGLAENSFVSPPYKNKTAGQFPPDKITSTKSNPFLKRSARRGSLHRKRFS